MFRTLAKVYAEIFGLATFTPTTSRPEGRPRAGAQGHGRSPRASRPSIIHSTGGRSATLSIT
jgi:hypothetical protein